MPYWLAVGLLLCPFDELSHHLTKLVNSCCWHKNSASCVSFFCYFCYFVFFLLVVVRCHFKREKKSVMKSQVTHICCWRDGQGNNTDNTHNSPPFMASQAKPENDNNKKLGDICVSVCVKAMLVLMRSRQEVRRLVDIFLSLSTHLLPSHSLSHW